MSVPMTVSHIRSIAVSAVLLACLAGLASSSFAGGPCLFDNDCVDLNECTQDICTEGTCAHPIRRFGDTNNDGAVNVIDLACADDCDATIGCEPNMADVGGALGACAANGMCDQDDIGHVLGAIENATPCLCVCGADAQCSDGLFCNGEEQCAGGVCLPGLDPCAGAACDELLNACFPCNPGDCDDGIFCNGVEQCNGGMCMSNPPPCVAGQLCDEFVGACVPGTTVLTCEPSADSVPVGGVADFDLFIQNAPNVRGYEVRLSVNQLAGVGGAFMNCFVNAGRPDFVFGTNPTAIVYQDCATSRFGGTVSAMTPVNVGSVPQYLGTIQLQISPAANDGDAFEVAIRPDPETIIVDVLGRRIPLLVGPSCLLLVGSDCQPNAVPDACDIDCGPPMGACDIPNCGISADCNLNGVPDECDIMNGTSSDVIPPLGVPDECVFWIDDAGNWFDGFNWSSGQFPNPAQNATIGIPTANVLLDGEAAVQSLTVSGNALFRLASPGPGVSLNVLGNGGVLNNATIQNGGNNQLAVMLGTFRVGTTGTYEGAPGGPLPNQSRLLAQRVEVSPTDRTATATATFVGGVDLQIDLTDSMQMIVAGDFVADGTETIIGLLPLLAEGAKVGPINPPTISVRDMALMSVGGDFVLQKAVQIKYGGVSAVGPTFSASLELAGDFVNETLYPAIFDWLEGKIVINGVAPQEFEVGGEDRGSKLTGFIQNFAIGRIEVTTGATVTFNDTLSNVTGAAGDTGEVLYVCELVLEAGSTINVVDTIIYYKSLQDNGATIDVPGNLILVDPSIPTVSQWGVVVMVLLIVTAGTIVFRRRASVHAA